MNEFTPPALPVCKHARITDTTYACPHIQCWVLRRGVVAEGDVRCTRCGVMLEWSE